MTSKQFNDRVTKKLTLLVLVGAAFIGACAQDESAQQSSAAAADPQQIDHPQNNPTADKVGEEPDDSVLDNSRLASKGVAQFGMIDIATAEIKPASGSDVTGSVSFKPGPERKLMQVDVQLSGLGDGEHGIHIHEIGDCSAKDAESAGGHFNPYNVSHGAPDAEAHHVGDLGNIAANAQGEVNTTLSFDFLAFSGPANILNKAVVIHSGSDDLKTDPAGNAGERVGCGVILAEQDVQAAETGEGY